MGYISITQYHKLYTEKVHYVNLEKKGGIYIGLIFFFNSNLNFWSRFIKSIFKTFEDLHITHIGMITKPLQIPYQLSIVLSKLWDGQKICDDSNPHCTYL